MFRVQVELITSPIRFLIAHLDQLAIAIAPERAQEASRIVRSLQLRVTNAATWEFCIYPEVSTIVISRRALEILWCAAYAYWIVYRKIAAAKVATGGATVVLDRATDPELSDAADLLQWAMEELLNEGPSSDLPMHLPTPVQRPHKASDLNVADEIALRAVGFFVWHEIGHYEQEHENASDENPRQERKRWRRKSNVGIEPNAYSIAQEREADYFAGDWILGGLTSDDAKFVNRALGAAVALTVDVAKTIHGDTQRAHGGRSHPRPYDRLINFFDRYLDGDGWNVVWAFLVASLKLHFDNSKIELGGPLLGHEDFRAAVDSYVTVLAERQAALRQHDADKKARRT